MVAYQDSGRKTKTVLLFLLVLFVLATIGLAIGLVITLLDKQNDKSAKPDVENVNATWPPPSPSIMGNFSKVAVAADNGVCSEIGRNILIRGGNAVDAAVAAVLCIGVLNSQSAGLGGGHFMTIYKRTTKTCSVIDARTRAPEASREDSFVNLPPTASIQGWLAVAVPGELHGLYTAYEKHGSKRVTWKDVVQPTIDLCRYGYVVSSSLGEAIFEKTVAIMNEPTMKPVFFNNDTGELYKAGEVMKRPTLADTLEKLANSNDPIWLFYKGDMAKSMAQEFQDNGGNITYDDFATYTSIQRQPVISDIGGLTICGPPPPSSATVVIGILNILAQYNITPEYLKKHPVENNVETLHRFVEAMKFAYGERQNLGDIDFDPDAMNISNYLISKEFALYAKSKIGSTANDNSSYYAAAPGEPARDHGTAHISILDAEGNAASVTTTVNLFFGAKVRSMSTGVIWNDEMDDFSTPGRPNYFGYVASPANYIKPKKRALSSMSPVILYDKKSGDVKIVNGAAGGSRIITATAYSLMRLLWFGENPKKAVDAPRLHNQLYPFITENELNFPQNLLSGLENFKNQNVTYNNDTATVCAIQRGTDGRLYANSDFRKPGGYPAGY